MIEAALLYIHSVSPEKRFIGCGALVEGGYIVTCRHVWDQATAQGGSTVEIEYPRSRDGGATVRRPASLADPRDVPSGVVSVQLALDRDYEVGPGYALAGLICNDAVRDVRIEGLVIGHVGADGRRQFTGANAQGYWSERGSSGSPVFVQGGQQLAGILSLSELGANQGKSPLHEAFVIPATIVRRYLTARLAAPVAEREHIDPEKLRAVLVQIGANGVPVPEIPARIAQFVSAAQARAV